ncbi:hypothetical protein Bbelb_321260 [Branchiostoma belcheri]|nr:hypothetical protein Bbelb_321260 [Branchiostoma belcheri]
MHSGTFCDCRATGGTRWCRFYSVSRATLTQERTVNSRGADLQTGAGNMKKTSVLIAVLQYLQTGKLGERPTPANGLGKTEKRAVKGAVTSRIKMRGRTKVAMIWFQAEVCISSVPLQNTRASSARASSIWHSSCVLYFRFSWVLTVLLGV